MRRVAALLCLTAFGACRAASGDVAETATHFGDPLGDVWIDEVRVTVLDDFDRDGFASALEVRVDVDTLGDAFDPRVDVIARFSLVGDDGVRRLLFDTRAFPVRGRSSADRIDVELVLLEAFPPGFYDLVIEVFDLSGRHPLDAVDGRAFAALGALALEDREFDAVGVFDDDAFGGHRGDGVFDDGDYVVTYFGGSSSSSGYGYASTSYVGVQYAGAATPVTLVLLALGLLLRLTRGNRTPARRARGRR